MTDRRYIVATMRGSRMVPLAVIEADDVVQAMALALRESPTAGVIPWRAASRGLRAKAERVVN